jgi:hypothetical protein
MPTSSLYVAVKRQLVAVLRSRVGLAGVRVDYAWMRGRAADGNSTPGEHVWLENLPTLMASDTPVATGEVRHPRHEVFSVGVNCQVADGGATEPDVVELRTLAILAEVDGVFADDKTLGGMAGLLEARLLGWSPLEPEFAGKGWAFRFVGEAQFSTWLN